MAAVCGVVALAFFLQACDVGSPPTSSSKGAASSPAGPTTSVPASPKPTVTSVLKIGNTPAQPSAAVRHQADRYLSWLLRFSATTFSGAGAAGQHDLARLANTYGGQADPSSMVRSIPGGGTEVRAQLSTAADRLRAGERALEKRQYGKARHTFTQLGLALDDSRTALQQDLLAVEQVNGVRLTSRGVASPHVHFTLATVDYWVDGDTVVTSRGRVRVLGINTPELAGRCGPAQAAKGAADQLAPSGTRVRLANPDSVRDTDRYGRLLRYVDVPGTSSRQAYMDVGYSLLLSGLAEARYDSRDGYQWHPRESVYRRTHVERAPTKGCVAEEERTFVLASVLTADKRNDEYARHELVADLLVRPRTSAATTLVRSVSVVERTAAQADRARQARIKQARRDRAEQAHRHRIERARRLRAARARRERAAQARHRRASSKKSSGSGTGGGSYPGYSGPRCYAPGGKTWKPC